MNNLISPRVYIKKIDNKLRIFYNKRVSYSINFNEEKSQILKTMRGISFKDIEKALIEHKFVKNKKHFNRKKYPNQFIFLVKIKNYIYIVPYVIDINKKEIFLKTIYPSRKFTKEYKETN